MKNDITRRDALALGVSAAALAATGASAQTASAIKAADVPELKLPIEKGASLRMLRPVRFVPDDDAGFLTLAKKLKDAGKPCGFALGNAVGDGNGFADWLMWSHNAALLDEEGNVTINSKETIAALKFVKELYPLMIPGTPSWN